MTILAEETVAELPLAVSKATVQTPCSPFEGELVDVGKVCCVSIVRAGDSLLGRFRAILPGVSVGKILIQRDEESEGKEAKMFYCKVRERSLRAVVGTLLLSFSSSEFLGCSATPRTFSRGRLCHVAVFTPPPPPPRAPAAIEQSHPPPH